MTNNEILQIKFKEILSKVNILLLNIPKLEFFGSISFSLNKEMKCLDDYTKDVQIPSSGYTDGKNIVYLVIEQFTNIQEIMFTTIHEIIHVLSNHIGRANDRKKEIWLLAADHVVNRVIKKLSEELPNLIAPIKNRIYFEDIDLKYPTASVEVIYELLLKEYENGFLKIENHNISINGFNNNDNIDNNSTLKKELFISILRNGNTFETFDDINFDDNINQYEKEKILKELNDIKTNAQMLWNSNFLNKGDYSNHIILLFNNLLNVKIPWDNILENVLLFSTQNKQDSSWVWPNEIIKIKRLPGEYNTQAPNTIIIGIDSSGSISDKELLKFLSIVCDSIEFFENLIMIVHDVKIQDIFEFGDLKNITKESLFDKIKSVKGRGGTSHKYIFDYIESISEECLISTIIFQTDYLSDVQKIYKNYKFIFNIETCWLIPSNISKHHVNLSNCKTKTIYID